MSASAIEQAFPWPYDALFRARVRLTKDFLIGKKQSNSLSTVEKLTAYYSGYTEDLFDLYGFSDGIERRDYLADVPRRAAKYINEDPDVLDSKKTFYEQMHSAGFGDFIPDRYGYIEEGMLVSEDYESLQSLLADEFRVVIKRPGGSGGKYVYICELDGGQIILKGKGKDTTTSEELIPDLDGYIVTEYCRQADYVNSIYPHSANTIRLTAIDSQKQGTFVAGAVHRVGSERSGALDNFSQYGLSVKIDDETGELGSAAQRTDDNDLIWHDIHPETEAQIRGVKIPNWTAIKDQILTITNELPGVAYVGWDIIVTGANGEFKIIEGNSFPNPRVFQVHRPFLADNKTREFFEQHGLA